ncbi:MAG: ORF6C domain-containing protein [Clostridium celatum]|nr:ORF6C domain-containing protein [Clostridium celatum]
MELIKIREEYGRQLVSGRELHEFLDVKSKYADWIKNRIKKYEFIELNDFITVSKILENGGKEYDHALTIEMAKELSMVENNDKGKEARKYFIKCEKKLNKVKQLSPMELMKLQYEVLQEHEVKIAGVHMEVEELKDNMPLFNVDCKELQSLVKRTGIKMLGGYRSKAYNNKSLRAKIYADIHQQIRREFGVNRYEAIKRCQLQKAMEIVGRYRAPIVLEDEITLVNSQVSFEEDNVK